MRRVICIWMGLYLASAALALSITNGDFELQNVPTYHYDIEEWYDYGGPNIKINQGPFFLGAVGSSIFGSKCVYMGDEANTDEDGGNHTYVYQSIGFYDGDPQVVDIELDWGLAPNKTAGPMGITVMILESDGTFVPGEWDGAAHEIYGKPGITEIGRGTVVRQTAAGVVMHERFQIDLADATIGNELFLRFNNYKVGGLVPYVQVDNITMSPASVVNQSPANGAIYIPVWRTSPENNLVFKVVDPSIIAVDVLFGPEDDPFLSAKPEYKIVQGMPVIQGFNTVTLENELTEDLQYSTDYFWKVLAYESDGQGGLSLKYTGLITSFKTIQEGPYLVGVSPAIAGVWPGEDAVFTVSFSVSADTFQWYKVGSPDAALEDGPDYEGTKTNTLKVLDVQQADEGTYYCVGKETATGLTAPTLSPGVLFIKELKTYFPFETTYTAGGDIYTPDVKGGKDMLLVGGASVIKSAADPNTLFGGYLSLRNPRGKTHTQYGSIADASVANYPDITISCWIKPEALDLDYERFARVFDFGKDADNYFYLTLLYRTNTAYCETMREQAERDVLGVGEIEYGTKWLYVVLTIKDGIGKIYINGQYGGGKILYIPSSISKPLNYIGKGIGGDSPPNFNGVMDELKIYNYARTAEEIAREYMEVRAETEFICDLENYDLAAWDFNANCRIDLPDFMAIAEKWLQNYLVYFD